MAEERKDNGKFQSWMLTLVGGVLASSIIALTSTISGFRSDIEVIKTEIKHIALKMDVQDKSSKEVQVKLVDHEVRIQRIELDNTRTHR